MKNTTLCYIEKDNKYLMLHRVKKDHDQSHGKWLGIGGKFEDKESPDECLLREVYEETGLKLTEIDALGTRERSQKPIVIAEDSHLLNKLISDALTKAGYVNQKRNEDGLAAWNYINECLDKGELDEKVACVITDIEMPQMDGHRLTKLIKTDDRLKHIPVVIFSSLVNEEMRRKGEALGADAQLSKPEIGKLVQEIDKLLQ